MAKKTFKLVKPEGPPMKEYVVEPGECPICGSVGNLDFSFGEREEVDEDIGYPFRCPDCGATGVERYAVVYSVTYARKGLKKGGTK